jgi:diaminohydroxyphosphoribosylaminopyrimidine deaminase/5-amino-6-(5-phosphoribosylamino)uracil reductase
MFVDAAYARLYSLCRNGLACSTPNPNVAAVILDEYGEIIAAGSHNRQISPDHAEVLALRMAGPLASGATMVVSLEPCAHTGVTGPCTQAIIDAGIARVIYAVKDPNPIAAGGAEVLTAAGIEVIYRQSPELEYIQRAWLSKVANQRPLMIWKVATTLDGKIAAADSTSQWISCEESRADVQLLRAQSDAILIGTNTAIVDNPHLVPRGHDGRPVRIICGEQEVPASHKVFDDQARTIVVASKDLSALTKVLVDEGFNQVLIEAGPTFGSALLAAGMVDEIVIYQAPKILGAGKSFIADLGITTLEDHIGLELISVEKMGSDVKSHYRVITSGKEK